MRFLLCFHFPHRILALFTPSLSLLNLEPVDSALVLFFGAEFFLFLLFCFVDSLYIFRLTVWNLEKRRKNFFASNKKYIYVQQRRSLIQCAYSRQMDLLKNMNRASVVSETVRESSDCTRLHKKVFELS
jgi:hypothetical protein